MADEKAWQCEGDMMRCERHIQARVQITEKWENKDVKCIQIYNVSRYVSYIGCFFKKMHFHQSFQTFALYLNALILI